MHMFPTVLTRETRWCHYQLDITLRSKVIVKLFQWNIDILSLMTSVAKYIKVLGAIPGTKMLLVIRKRYRSLFQIPPS